MSKAYSPCRSVDKTNWYTYLAQLERIARLDQPDQGRQCIKAIEQYLKIKATRPPKITFLLINRIMLTLVSLIYRCFPV